MVNDHLLSHGLTETPWGGPRDSGVGRGHGGWAFEEVTQPQVVVVDWLKLARRNVFWHPYDRDLYQGLKGVMFFLYGKGLGERLAGVSRFLKIMPRMFSAKPPAAVPIRTAPQPEPPLDSLTPVQRVARLERWGEEAYTRMYDARSPSGDYSEAKENFHAAIALATDLGLTEEAARLEQRLEHIKGVFRSQFS